MIEKLNGQESLKLKTRLQSRLDYYVAVILWGLFFFSFFSVWMLGSLDPLQTILLAALYLFFPLFATFGMISDRILAIDLLKYSDKNSIKIYKKIQNGRFSMEDLVLVILILSLIFFNLPWIAARFGFTQVLFYQPVHLGEHHGWIGTYMLISILLITKTEKLYLDSLFKEISIYLLCFLAIWGCGLVIDDFTTDQLNYNAFPFVVWSEDANFFISLSIQIVIVAMLSLILYYFGWRKYYKKRLK